MPEFNPGSWTVTEFSAAGSGWKRLEAAGSGWTKYSKHLSLRASMPQRFCRQASACDNDVPPMRLWLTFVIATVVRVRTRAVRVPARGKPGREPPAPAGAATMGHRCCSAGPGNRNHGPWMSFPQQRWPTDAVTRPGRTASMAHRCGSPRRYARFAVAANQPLPPGGQRTRGRASAGSLPVLRLVRTVLAVTRKIQVGGHEARITRSDERNGQRPQVPGPAQPTISAGAFRTPRSSEGKPTRSAGPRSVCSTGTGTGSGAAA